MSSFHASLNFPPIAGKDVVACFDGGDVTSDAGLLLVSQTDQRLGFSEALQSEMQDRRQQGKVEHPQLEMLRARIYNIVQGYSDCNDMDTLRYDPALKIGCGVLPGGASLASQPTLSRFENSVTAGELKRMERRLAQQILQGVPADTRLVTLEVDATDDPCHGQQQFELFNGYYREHCYVPLLVHLVLPNGRRLLLMTMLRPGNSSSGKGVVGMLREAIRLVRERLGRKVLIIVRADSGFGTGRIIDFLSSQKVGFVLGLPSNSILTGKAERAHLRAAVNYKFEGEGCRVFDEFGYSARSWAQSHRVVVKVEMTQRSFNPRYVVSNLWEGDPEEIYEYYCARGEQENRIKELKLDMDSGRTSCCSFQANRVRLLLHTAAYALMNGLRGALAGTVWANAQMGTLRLRLLKVGARVVESHRKVWFHLPTSYPSKGLWQHLISQLQGSAPAVT